MEMKTQKRILVVDEDLLTIANISQTLLRGGYVISHATDHQTALKVIQDEKPDLIICNLEGRSLDSHQLVSRVQQARAFRTIPFLFVVESHRDPARAPEILGPKQYLKKPFTREELASAVQEHLNRRSQKPTN
jgi:twitching motility two-component system response regulator PilG